MYYLKIGCCGFPKSRKEYTTRLSVVEIQKTFYSIPKLDLVKRWREDVPLNFEFTLKAVQIITHPATSPTYRKARLRISENKKERIGFFKPTDEVFNAWEETKAIADTLKAKIIVFQSPPSFLPTYENKENMKRFFRTIEEERFTFAWEARGEWSYRDILTISEDLNLIPVVDPFNREHPKSNLIYLRLHGRGRGYRYTYSKEELFTLYRYFVPGRSYYVMFNNTDMWRNALELKTISRESI